MNQHYFSLKNLIRFTTVLITINTVLGIVPLAIFPNLSQFVQAQENAEAYYNRGVAKSQLGDFQGAITDYDQAIKIKPDYAEAYYNRGLAKQNLEDNQGAIADYNQAIKIKPDYALAYLNRGVAKSDLGDKQGVIADYDQAAQLFSQNMEWYRMALNNKKGFWGRLFS